MWCGSWTQGDKSVTLESSVVQWTQRYLSGAPGPATYPSSSTWGTMLAAMSSLHEAIYENARTTRAPSLKQWEPATGRAARGIQGLPAPLLPDLERLTLDNGPAAFSSVHMNVAATEMSFQSLLPSSFTQLWNLDSEFYFSFTVLPLVVRHTAFCPLVPLQPFSGPVSLSYLHIVHISSLRSSC